MHKIIFKDNHKCPSCNSKKNYQTGYEIFYQSKIKILRCASCNHGYPSKQPKSERELKKFYTSRDSNSFQKSNFFSNFIRGIRSKVIAKKNNIQKNHKILDFGCGDGIFGYSLFKQNFDVTISDFFENAPNKKLSEIYISNKKLFKSNKKFDFIFLRHVLEHTINPKQFIFNLNNILANKGTIIIEVPVLDGIWVKIFKENCDSVITHEHLHFFTPQFFLKNFSNEFDIKISNSNYVLLGRTIANFLNLKKNDFSLFSLSFLPFQLLIESFFKRSPSAIQISIKKLS